MLVIFTLRCMGRTFIYTSTARGVPRAPLVFSLTLVTEGGESLTLIPAGPNSTMVWELGWFELYITRTGEPKPSVCVCGRDIISSYIKVLPVIERTDYGLQKIGFTVLLILYKLYIRTVKQSCSSLANYGTFDNLR